MSEFLRVLLALVFYRTITMLTGVLIIYLGYKLFVLGIYEKAGELKAAWGDRHLTLRQAAPGTFFALFGTILVSMSLWRGIQLDDIKKQTANEGQQPSTGLSTFTIEPDLSDSEINDIMEKAKKGPLTKEDYEKLKTWKLEHDVHIKVYHQFDSDKPPKV